MNKIKKYFYISYLFIIIWINNVFAKPEIIGDVENLLPWSWVNPNQISTRVWWELISNMIKYVAVIAVITVMLSWIMYLISGWEEEKVKKAKNWIIWSLVWVFLSVSAMAIIKIINNIYI